MPWETNEIDGRSEGHEGKGKQYDEISRKNRSFDDDDDDVFFEENNDYTVSQLKAK